ncbi:hypothetical protein [Bombilactobacillus folatiphilus]
MFQFSLLILTVIDHKNK